MSTTGMEANEGITSHLCNVCCGIIEHNTRCEWKDGKYVKIQIYPHYSNLSALRSSVRSGCDLCQLFFNGFPWEELQLSEDEKDLLVSETALPLGAQESDTTEALDGSNDGESITQEQLTSNNAIERLTPSAEGRLPPRYFLPFRGGEIELPEGTNPNSQLITMRLGLRQGSDRGRLFVSREQSEYVTLTMVMSGRKKENTFPVNMVSYVQAHADPGGPLALSNLSRLRAFDRADPSAIITIRGWLQECHHFHRLCGSYMKSQPLPKRLVEITGGPRETSLRLLETGGQRGRFISLSYCWGNPEYNLRTTRANYREMLKGIELTSLPAVVKDAVTFCRALGICYFWVDALCIKQDDETDWGEEAANIASIYSRSVVVIAASASSDSAQGFIMRQMDTQPVRFQWHDPTAQSSDNVYLTPPGQSFQRLIANSPLSKRGWTLQGRYLAPRILHFGEQMFWECWETVRSEDCRSNKRFIGLDPDPNRDLLSPHYDGSERPRYHDVKDRWSKFEYWSIVVEEFSSRALTKPGEKLPAVQGITELLKGQFEDRYFARVWETTFDLDLLWRRKNSDPMIIPSTERAPSWSWAALDGPIIPWTRLLFEISPDNDIIQKHIIQVEAQLLECGLDSDRYLGLAAPIKRARFLQPDESLVPDDPSLVDFVQQDFSVEILVTEDSPRYHYWTSIFDTVPDNEAGAFYLVRINSDVTHQRHSITNKRELIGTSLWALIVQKSAQTSPPNSLETYRRVGVASCPVRPHRLRQHHTHYRDAHSIHWKDHCDTEWDLKSILLV